MPDPVAFGEQTAPTGSRPIHTGCPACGDRGALMLLPYPDGREAFFVNLALLSCLRCGISWVPNRLAGLGEYYRAEYSVAKGRYHDVAPAELFRLPQRIARIGGARSERHAALLHAQLPQIGTVVDFGCGYGYTLSLLNAKRRLGVEPDSKMAPFTAWFGIETVATTAELGDASADCIVSSHSLEHVEAADLLATLAELARVLRPGGFGVIEVPNAPLLRLAMPNQRHAPHVLFFSREAFERVLTRAGFAIVSIDAGSAEDWALAADPLYRPERAEHDCRSKTITAVVTR